MTKEQHIETLQIRLHQLSDKIFQPQYLESVMSIIWEKMIFSISGKATIDEAFYGKLFPAVPVLQESSGLYYCAFPSPIIHLERVGSGVISINQINAHEFDFVPVSDKMFSLLPNQEMYDVSNKLYYKVSYSTILFCDKMTSDIAGVGVDINMIIPFTSFGYTDHVAIPAGQIEGFFDAAVARIIGTPAADLLNKNAPPEWNRNTQAQ